MFINGKRVANDDSWESPTSLDVAKHLKVGANVVAVYGWNDGGPAGLAVRLAWQQGDEQVEIVTDRSWRCFNHDPDGWNDVGFDDSNWPKKNTPIANVIKVELK